MAAKKMSCRTILALVSLYVIAGLLFYSGVHIIVNSQSTEGTVISSVTWGTKVADLTCDAPRCVQLEFQLSNGETQTCWRRQKRQTLDLPVNSTKTLWSNTKDDWTDCNFQRPISTGVFFAGVIVLIIAVFFTYHERKNIVCSCSTAADDDVQRDRSHPHSSV